MFTEIHKSGLFQIALLSGEQKLSPLAEYLKDFIDDMKKNFVNGIKVSGQLYHIKLAAFICDSPARSFLKGVKGHEGYNACERCIQGDWDGKKVIFPDMDAPLRTDLGFNNMQDAAHHHILSPLCELNVGLVSQFVLDYMHLVCLGVVRKLICLWIGGPLKTRLPSTIINTVSQCLASVRKHIPDEFACKPCSLSEVKMWKATEQRQFLLYTGPIALQGNIKSAMYRNFLLLSVCITVLLSPDMCLLSCDYIQDLLRTFVINFSAIYGKKQPTYNVHSLLHLVHDASQYGCLDNFSCFPFENALGKTKRMVRKPQSPVAQICRRLTEFENSAVTLFGVSDFA